MKGMMYAMLLLCTVDIGPAPTAREDMFLADTIDAVEEDVPSPSSTMPQEGEQNIGRKADPPANLGTAGDKPKQEISCRDIRFEASLGLRFDIPAHCTRKGTRLA